MSAGHNVLGRCLALLWRRTGLEPELWTDDGPGRTLPRLLGNPAWEHALTPAQAFVVHAVAQLWAAGDAQAARHALVGLEAAVGAFHELLAGSLVQDAHEREQALEAWHHEHGASGCGKDSTGH